MKLAKQIDLRSYCPIDENTREGIQTWDAPETGEWGEELSQTYARRLRDGFSLATLSPSSPSKGNAAEQVPWESIVPRAIHSASIPDTSQKLTLASPHKQNQKLIQRIKKHESCN